MGKKKHKREREEAERRRAEAAAKAAGPTTFDPAPLAGIAAAAMERLNTPEFRTLMSGALGAAAQAFDRRRAAPTSRAPAAPVPPGPPMSPVPQAEGAYRASVEGPAFTLPPDTAAAIDRVAVQAGQALESAAAIAAAAIGTAAAAVERWAEQQQQGLAAARKPDGAPGE